VTVYYLPGTGSAEDDTPGEIARELVFLAGPCDPMLLPDDDAFDLAAVELAANGARPVRLTLPERLAAASRLLASGVSVRSVCLRLGLPSDTEHKWRQLHTRVASIVSVILVIVAVAAGVLAAGHTRVNGYRAHHGHIRVSRSYRLAHGKFKDNGKEA